MANPENGLQGSADSKQLISQLLMNVSALSEALNKEDNIKRSRPSYLCVEEECSNLFKGQSRRHRQDGGLVPGPDQPGSSQMQTPQVRIRSNFGNKRKFCGSRKAAVALPPKKPIGPFKKTLILMCGPEDLHVPRQGHKPYLHEQKQIVQEVLFLKQWNFNQVITKIK